MEIGSRVHLGEFLHILKLPRRIAEVGVAAGVFSKEMLAWNLEEMYLIDIWTSVPFMEGCAGEPIEWHEKNYNAVKKMVDEYKGDCKIFIKKGFSHEVVDDIPDNYLSLIYIDADHTYKGCKTDIAVWWDKLMVNGIMAFHDYMNQSYGVCRAVNEYADKQGIEVHLLKEDGKIENQGAWIQKIR